MLEKTWRSTNRIGWGEEDNLAVAVCKHSANTSQATASLDCSGSLRGTIADLCCNLAQSYCADPQSHVLESLGGENYLELVRFLVR